MKALTKGPISRVPLSSNLQNCRIVTSWRLLVTQPIDHFSAVRQTGLKSSYITKTSLGVKIEVSVCLLSPSLLASTHPGSCFHGYTSLCNLTNKNVFFETPSWTVIGSPSPSNLQMINPNASVSEERRRRSRTASPTDLGVPSSGRELGKTDC